jgi:lambda family phage portal protein
MRLKFWGRSAPLAAAEHVGAAGAAAPVKRRTWFARTLGQMFKSGTASSLDRWTTTPQSADAIISLQLVPLVARSREQWQNNDYVRAFVRLARQNVVGPQGVIFQSKVKTPRGKLDKDVATAIEDAWCEWGKAGNCDVTGKMSWRGLQCLALETAARDGEYIFRKVYGADAGPFGFALQMIDPMRLPVSHEEYHPRDGGFLRHGIEFNRYGRAVAYHFTSTEEWDSLYYNVNGRGFVRVPASEIIHDFVHELVGQKRGLPWASTGLFRLHHLQGFEDASVQNARASATKMGFIQYRDGFGPEAESDEPLNIQAEPLSMQELPEGAEFVPFNPNYPAGEFHTFHKAMLRGASAGMGVPYNDLANDLEGVNFSSIRQGTLDAREHYKELQQWLIESLIEPVFNEWIRYQLLAGNIKVKGKPLPAEKLSSYKAASWQPRRWQWIDPRADVDAAVSSIRAGLTSPSQVIREQGRDPEQVFTELAQDMEAMKAAGIPPDVITLFFMGVPPPPPAKESTSKAAE